MSAPPQPRWLTADMVLLDERCPLPLDRPFTVAEMLTGVSRWYARELRRRGLVREVLRGVYAAAQVRDTIELRVQALGLVVPPTAVVTDRTAAWLHGVDLLHRSAAYEAPPVEMFDRRHAARMRRAGVRSGQRMMPDSDVMVLHGILVTTPLRTALDLGRLLPRYDALAALDGFLRLGVQPERVLESIERFRGERGVVQLRELAPLADRRAESPPESVLRGHWIDAGLATPEPQWWVEDEHGVPAFRIDVGLPALRFGAEYNGERFHTGEGAEGRDEARSTWLAERGGWTIAVFWRDDLFGREADPAARLHAGVRQARQALASWRPQGHYL